MGMFDEVIGTCPQCGESVEWQSKAGEYLGVCYDNLVGLLVQAVKELWAKVKQMEAKQQETKSEL